MWETINLIVKYAIESGGIWGFLLLVSLAWIGFREWKFFQKEKKKEPNDENVFIKETALIKERQENQVKASEKNLQYIEELNEKLSELLNSLSKLEQHNKHHYENIESLTKKLQNVNDERVDELKEILSQYNKSMSEFSLVLQNINFILKNRR